jgi:hypothetical protein
MPQWLRVVGQPVLVQRDSDSALACFAQLLGHGE